MGSRKRVVNRNVNTTGNESFAKRFAQRRPDMGSLDGQVPNVQ